jgi:hypothetical protein
MVFRNALSVEVNKTKTKKAKKNATKKSLTV